MFKKTRDYISKHIILQTFVELTIFAAFTGMILSIIHGDFIHLQAFAGYLPGTAKENNEYIKNLPYPESDKTALRDLTVGILGYVKILVGAIGVLMVTIVGGQLVMARGNEEDITKGKNALIYIIVAFVIVSMAEDFANILDLSQGTLLESPTHILKKVRLFDNRVEVIITFIKYFIGAIATFMIASSGMKLITNADDEETVSASKRNIMYSVIGLIMITVSDMVINKVLYKVDKKMYTGIEGVSPQLDVKRGIEEIVGITNLMVGIIGPVILIILTVASVMYLTAGGDEEKMGKAKRMVIAAIIGVIVMYGAFAIVSTVLSSKLMSIGAITD